MGGLEERHPGQFAFSPSNKSSPDDQLGAAAQFRSQTLSTDLSRQWGKSEIHRTKREDLL